MLKAALLSHALLTYTFSCGLIADDCQAELREATVLFLLHFTSTTGDANEWTDDLTEHKINTYSIRVCVYFFTPVISAIDQG